MISFNPSLKTHQTQEFVAQVLEKGNLSAGGPFTDKMGALISDLHLGAQTYLTKSCTAALEFAALLLSIGPGDEVILPSFTFSSTANAFALRGATLKFADMDPATFTAELPQITPHLTKKTRAVVTMAYGGVTRDIKTISHHCQALNIPLVQDNALGLFATVDGVALGAIGDMSTLSFHQTKSLSCGEGGALVINKAIDTDRADCIANNGTNRLAFLRGAVDNYTWQSLGSNMGLSELLAAVLSAQFERSNEWQIQRKAIWSIYNEHISGPLQESGGRAQWVPSFCEPSYHVFSVVLPKHTHTKTFIDNMAANGIDVRTHYEPLHTAPAYSMRHPLPITENLAGKLVRLPLHPAISEKDAYRVVETFLNQLRVKNSRSVA